MVLVALMFLTCGSAYAQTATAVAAPNAPAVKYSLEEERYIAAFQKEGLSKAEKAIEEVVGKKISVEVDFPSFAGNFDSMKYVEGSYSTDVVVSVFKTICSDEIGKRRLSEAVKKVVIKHSKDAGQDSFTLDKGSLVILTNLASSGINSSNLEAFLQKSI